LAESHDIEERGAQHTGVSPLVLNLLEALDNIAHVVVAIFFIILAGSVLVYASLLLVRQMPLVVQSPHAVEAPAPRTAPTEPGAASPEHRAVELERQAGPEEADRGASLFLHRSLELLSTLLFVVIVLELLKTIITYLKTHNIQAIMKEFLVVGIISSIRKILLVGAESSLGSADPTAAYIKEATGTVITIAGILLLIAGLIFLQVSEVNNPLQKRG